MSDTNAAPPSDSEMPPVSTWDLEPGVADGPMPPPPDKGQSERETGDTPNIKQKKPASDPGTDTSNDNYIVLTPMVAMGNVAKKDQPIASLTAYSKAMLSRPVKSELALVRCHNGCQRLPRRWRHGGRAAQNGVDMQPTATYIRRQRRPERAPPPPMSGACVEPPLKNILVEELILRALAMSVCSEVCVMLTCLLSATVWRAVAVWRLLWR